MTQEPNDLLYNRMVDRRTGGVRKGAGRKRLFNEPSSQVHWIIPDRLQARVVTHANRAAQSESEFVAGLLESLDASTKPR